MPRARRPIKSLLCWPPSRAAAEHALAWLGLTRFFCAPAALVLPPATVLRMPSVWLDVGANNGAFSSRVLAQYNFSTSLLIEPNPRFVPELDLLHRRYGAKVVHAAAWVNDTTLLFHINRNDEASSLLKRSPTGNWGSLRCKPPTAFDNLTAYARRAWNGVIARRVTRKGVICDTPREERVAVLDLATLLERHASCNDIVLMKMDVEVSAMWLSHEPLRSPLRIYMYLTSVSHTCGCLRFEHRHVHPPPV